MPKWKLYEVVIDPEEDGNLCTSYKEARAIFAFLTSYGAEPEIHILDPISEIQSMRESLSRVWEKYESLLSIVEDHFNPTESPEIFERIEKHKKNY